MIAGVVAGLFAIGVLALLGRVRRYRAWFHVPSKRNDHLTCRGRHGLFPLSAGPDGFHIPAGLERSGQTVLLGLEVKVTPLGRLLDPFIEVREGQRRHRQFFERGAEGRRYLNLSPFFESGERPSLAPVSLRGRSIRWKAGASLLVFDPPAAEDKSILVLAPHPDDAEIAAFGMYSSHRSWVVTVTAGERAVADVLALVAPAEGTRWTAWLRVLDSLIIPQLGQVPPERCVNLVCPDGTLERMYREPTRPFRLGCEEILPRTTLRSRNQVPELQRAVPDCTWNGLVTDLRAMLDRAKPQIVVCPHPSMDAHPDHVFTTVALERALRDLGQKPALILLYVLHSRGAPSYPLGPADSLVSPPPCGDEGWIAESLYSHPLTPETRQAKYFAVEAMHGVRSYPGAGPQSGREILATLKRELSARLAGLDLHPASLLRRAPRPNEMYYVVSPSALSELIERTLGAAASASNGERVGG